MSAAHLGGLEIGERVTDASHTLALSGELDLSTADRLRDAVTRLCASEGARELTLDLRDLTFIDSSGLAVVVYASRLCERAGWALSVIRGPKSVQDVFELTGLTELLAFRTSPGGSSPG